MGLDAQFVCRFTRPAESSELRVRNCDRRVPQQLSLENRSQSRGTADANSKKPGPQPFPAPATPIKRMLCDSRRGPDGVECFVWQRVLSANVFATATFKH